MSNMSGIMLGALALSERARILASGLLSGLQEHSAGMQACLKIRISRHCKSLRLRSPIPVAVRLSQQAEPESRSKSEKSEKNSFAPAQSISQ